MTTEAPTATLADQLRERMRSQRSDAVNAKAEASAGTTETREQYEQRIMDTPDAWTGIGGSTGSILPR